MRSSAPSTIIDLSHRLEDTISVYPGSPLPSFSVSHTIAEHGFNQRNIRMQSHVGTHMDAPFHLIAAGKKLTDYPIGRFLGEGLVIPCRPGKHISLEDLLPYERRIGEVAFVLLSTGWDRYWGSPQYVDSFPVPTREAAAWLANFPLTAVGLDTCSPDPVGSPDYANHHALLGNDIFIIENLKGLHRLPENNFELICLPLPIAEADGAPVRAIARW